MKYDVKIQFVVLEWTESELEERGCPFGVAYQVSRASTGALCVFAFLQGSVLEQNQSIQRFRTDILRLTFRPLVEQMAFFHYCCSLSMGPVRAGLAGSCSSDLLSSKMGNLFAGHGAWPNDFIDAKGMSLTSSLDFRELLS